MMEFLQSTRAEVVFKRHSMGGGKMKRTAFNKFAQEIHPDLTKADTWSVLPVHIDI